MYPIGRHRFRAMNVFAIISPEPNPKLEEVLKEQFEANDRLYVVAPGQYLVASDLTSKRLNDKIGISNGDMGLALILRIGTYTGWHHRPMWEWIDAKQNLPPDTAAGAANGS